MAMLLVKKPAIISNPVKPILIKKAIFRLLVPHETPRE
jgi:hypothetical protein